MGRRERGNIVELPFLLLLVGLFLTGVAVLYPRVGWWSVPLAVIAPAILFFLVRAWLGRDAHKPDLAASPASEAPSVGDFRVGVADDAWSADYARKLWRRFEESGPHYSKPTKRHAVASTVPAWRGTLYVGLYPSQDFDSLAEFVTFQSYCSSIQQDLLQTGEIDMASFYPEDMEQGVARMAMWWQRVSDLPEGGDFAAALRNMRLPNELGWLSNLKPTAVIYHGSDGELALEAHAPDGYVTMFTVDDR
jgi:hypothetical protein